MDYFLFFLALFSGGFMAWGVGANDVANAMGTSVGSKVITIKQAILIAAVFEGLGAIFGSGGVTDTIRYDLLDIEFYQNDMMVLAYGMIASLLASATWLMLATNKGWPVSTTHSIIGAVVGFGMVSQGPSNIQWIQIISIAASWLVTPIISGITGFIIFKLVQKLVLRHAEPAYCALAFFAACIGGLAFLAGQFVLDQVDIQRGSEGLSIIFAAIFVSGAYYWRQKSLSKGLSYRQKCQEAERIFGMLALITACIMAFAHGANDVANAIGPLASVIEILKFGSLQVGSPLPPWVLGFGAAGVVFGLAIFGYKIMASVGSKITVLSPSRSFSAQSATGMVVLGASWFGFPVSTTHTLVGAVLGVGLARGLAAVDLHVVRGIFMSWVITIPAGALFSIFYFAVFGVMF
ncbi:inorganic phosphate transporter [Candidatus Synchoanobacter obligatus]|uniref:Phosphate transporter n=1 Tax=Candidatus Synchoanobacter obligatus TaxID=2919597 RepID=A0ABT1L4R2_9GAMM|nr:inorganic phosphate transporter [Candidatus Synchoanobacter obligatus]MCP8352152.1 inorganic phosphate transporter [Candidatus Synchoanobacter obligatus]